MTTTNCQPPDCPCFCPSAALPLAVILVPEGGPGTVVQVPIFGTQPFQVSIETNPLFPIAQVPIIASVQMVAGNTLLITTGIPAPNETLGNYAATLRVCNPCGELIITVPLEVVADLTPVVSDCTLAQGVWTFENRTPTAGDTILAFTPAGCRALLPPTAGDVCTALQSLPTVVPTPVDTVFGNQGGACVQFSVANLVTPTSVCAALNALGPLGGPLAPTDEFVILRAGGCALATLTAVSVGFDICAALQNLPNAVVQPTAVFYGQQGGNCFEFAVADLLALIGASPILAANGSCAAPTYSFSSDTDSGMFFTVASPVLDGGGPAVVIGWDNCDSRVDVGESVRLTAANGDFIEVGASIQINTVGNLFLQAAGAIFATDGFGNQIELNTGNIRITATGGSVLIQTGPPNNRLEIMSTGDWEIGNNPGIFGDFITSQGPGLPPVWTTVPPPSVAFPLLAPNGSCAAPSYSFTASPDSGMFYTGTAVRIGDDSCTDFIEVGASITLQTASTLTATAATSLTIQSAGGSVTVQSGLGGGAGALLTARAPSGFKSAFFHAADHITQPRAQMRAEVFLGTLSDLDVSTTGIQGSTTGSNGMLWNSTNHTFRTGALQELLVLGPGLGVFAVGNFLRIDRAASGSPPSLNAMGNPDANVSINITPKGTGNILAPSGSCALPMYSFTASPDSGMFYTGTAVRIADDNCADFIEVGASITLQTASTLSASAAGQVTVLSTAAGVSIVGADIVDVSSTSDKVIITAANNIEVTAASTLLLNSTNNPVIITAAADNVHIRGQTGVNLRTGASDRVTINSGGVVSFVNGATLVMSTDNGYQASGQTSGAGVSVGTLNNAPSAGDPAFWLRVVINGVNHFVPAWT